MEIVREDPLAVRVGGGGSGTVPVSGMIPVAVEQGVRLFRGDGLMEVVIDHADRAEAAGGEAFCEFDGELAIAAHGDGVVVVRVGTVDAGVLAERFHQFVAAGHGARERAADPDVVFAGSRLAEARVEGDDFGDLDVLESEFCGHPWNGFFRDVAEVVLDEVQDRQHRAPFGNGVVRDGFVDLGEQLRRDGHDANGTGASGKRRIPPRPLSGKANL